MDTVRVGILSDNRKLRFACRTLLTEEAQEAISVAVEGISLHELGSWHEGADNLDVILLDYRNVYPDHRLFFSRIREIFPHSSILLMIDEGCRDKGQYTVQGTIEQKCSFRQLWTAITDLVKPRAASPQTSLNFF